MKVKVNRVRGGSMGDQRNYGLITGSIWNYEDKPSSNQVGTTMSPVPRDEATIEAERGETIVGDLDNDGMLEHAIVGGKRHFAGGTPLNVPDGSFVFSDTRALKINNKDVLKGIFNMGGTGITPAKVAKRYDLNQYKDLLMDPESDLLTKKTAQMMIDNNMKKLGQLALIQEGMKGFPDGIPNIALPLFANDIAQPESSEGTPMMKRGGLVKAQGGKQVKKMTPEQNAATTTLVQKKAAQKAFTQWRESSFGTPEESIALKRISKLMQDGWSFPTLYDFYKNSDNRRKSNIFFNPSDPKKGFTVLDKDLPVGTPAQNQAMHNLVLRKAQQKAIQKMTTPDKTGAYERSQAAGVEAANKLYTEALLSGDPKKMREASLKLDETNIPGLSTPIGTFGEIGRNIGSGIASSILGFPVDFSSTEPYGATWQEKIYDMRDILDREARNLEGLEQYRKNQKSIQKDVTSYTNKYNQVLNKMNDILNNPNNYSSDMVQKAIKWNEEINDPRFLGLPTRLAAKPNPYQQVTSLKFIKPSELTEGSNIDLAYNELFGKTNTPPSGTPKVVSKSKIASYTAGAPDTTTTITNFDPTTNQVQTVAPTQPKVSKPTSVTQTYNPREIEIDSTVLENISKEYGGNIKYQNGREKFTAYRPESKITSSQDWGVIPPSQTFPYKFGVQSFDPNLGVYTISDPKTGKNIPLDLTDYYNRLETTEKETGIPIISSYDKGADQLKKDIISPDLATRKKAVGHVQRAYNEARTKLGLPPYFYGKPGKDPYGIDEMFGLYTFSSPGLKKMQTLQPAGGGQDQEPVATTQTTELGKIPSPTYTGGYAAPWSNYSMVDNAAALANYFNISRGDLPIKQRFTPYMPDETFMNPARAIAQQQGLTRASQEAIMSGADPTTGRANVIAAQAAAAPQTADIMSKYDQANVGIANQMESARAQILNEAELRNLGLDKQYMDEIATLNQQYQNALAAGRTEVAESVKRAMVDAMQRGALNVQNPNYAIGPNGQIYFKPGFNPATGTNIFAGTSGLGNIPALMKSYMTDYQLTGDQAAALIRAQLASRGRNSYGVSNPMDALWNSEV